MLGQSSKAKSSPFFDHSQRASLSNSLAIPCIYMYIYQLIMFLLESSGRQQNTTKTQTVELLDMSSLDLLL